MTLAFFPTWTVVACAGAFLDLTLKSVVSQGQLAMSSISLSENMSNIEDLELQYSPSRWSKRFQNPDDVIRDYEDRTAAGSEACRSEAKDCIKVYDYGVGANENIIVVSPTPHGIAGCNVLAYIHGGYWAYGSHETMLHPVSALSRERVAYASIGYDLAPAISIEGIVEQIKTATKLLLTVALHSGAKGVYLVGHSAGAHLAAMMLFVDWKAELDETLYKILASLFRGTVLISGVYDLVPLLPTYLNIPLKMDRAAAEKLSPMRLLEVGALVDPAMKGSRCLVCVAQHDSPAFHDQSQLFAQLLGKNIAAVQFEEVADVDHFDIITRLCEESFSMTKHILTFVAGWLV